jgi:plasmid stabilization system protein ParE
MPYKITLSAGYRKSLNEISDYLIAFSPRFARNLKTDLEQLTATLKQLPFLYPEYEHSGHMILPLRKMVITGYNYTLFYQVLEDKKEVRLYDIVHQSRDIDAVLSRNAA